MNFETSSFLKLIILFGFISLPLYYFYKIITLWIAKRAENELEIMRKAHEIKVIELNRVQKEKQAEHDLRMAEMQHSHNERLAEINQKNPKPDQPDNSDKKV